MDADVSWGDRRYQLWYYWKCYARQKQICFVLKSLVSAMKYHCVQKKYIILTLQPNNEHNIFFMGTSESSGWARGAFRIDEYDYEQLLCL